MKTIVFTVTNDLSFDQRMDRICTSLSHAGFRCTLVGRKLPHSLPLTDKAFEQVRLRCWFHKGKMFYLEYNLRLAWYLLRHKFDVYSAVDLDTCMPVYAVSRLKDKPIVFDAHEYFSELEEVVTRPFVHRIWQWVEAFIMKRATKAYTISEGYAALFKARYGTEFEVIRNVPRIADALNDHDSTARSSRPYLIYQGALNIGRGLEESVLAMHDLPDYDLKIYGDGPIRLELEELIAQERLGDRVHLEGALRPEALRSKTQQAFAGLTLFSATGLHHQHSLANRFFDYIHGRIPQVAIGHSEYKRFVANHPVAVLIEALEPAQIASAVKQLEATETYQSMKDACATAASAHHWENEAQSLIQLYRSI